jgi:hypothetical protein
MARKPRVEFSGALYHVICRGKLIRTPFKKFKPFNDSVLRSNGSSSSTAYAPFKPPG